MLRYESGDLFENNHQAYAHGVNSLGIMSSGIAIIFREKYNDMYKEYRKLCLKKKLELGDIFFYESSNKLPSVFNLVTQETLNFAEPEALISSFEKMLIFSREKNITDIGIPKIGTGHGKLEEKSLLRVIEPFIFDPNIHLTLYKY